MSKPLQTLNFTDTFDDRHIGPRPEDVELMLAKVGYASIDELIEDVVPAPTRYYQPLKLSKPRTESEMLADLRQIAFQNQVFRSFIGMGYYNCIYIR